MINIVINDFIEDAAYSEFGEQPPRRKSFRWLTDIVKYDSGKEQRNQILARPLRIFNINWNWMDESARDKLVELFHRARGRATTFLFRDNMDLLCVTGDHSETAVGGETTTQLKKTYYIGESESWTENKTRIWPSAKYSPKIYLDVGGGPILKTEGTHFTLDDLTGIVNWAAGSAPNGALGAGDVVTADYKFYFEVRFDLDVHQDVEHYIDYWRTEGVKLLEVIE
jgi:uncharacterized protein (TIGR02217 family)